jgi:hypothetical protein
MGRYAQARRRGGGGGAPPPAPSLPAVVSATDLGAGQIQLVFDQPITVLGFGVPDSACVILGGASVTVTAAAQVDAVTMTIDQGLDPSAGSDLTWGAQPAFVLESIDLSTTTPVV